MIQVLVPCDGSPFSDTIFPALSKLLQPDHHQLHLLMVLPADGLSKLSSNKDTAAAKDFSGAKLASLQQSENQHDSFEQHLKQLQRRLEARGFKVSVERDQGDPAERIIAHAHKVDMIAMATHGRSGLSRLLLGSVAETILKQSHVPVLMIRPGPEVAEETLPQSVLAPSS